ncbi:MAG: GMP/IMP nucleotidase [Candidatus Thiodiazotropha sp.]|nr:GMP/IMP nucleotidase [Candidatus Thiodiazotropha sp.]MCM8881772.1 GMP/IMP nucleotidase [Candidatus Thiodiazotropha sp.]MCM8920363.1 GMP/IMP nucleotidase [Candidatus Thiodiazotropha sp.]
MIDWNEIDCVMLDMDGTLLDLHFDNHFWLKHVPSRYAEAKGMSLDQATQELLARYKSVEGTLEWYCVDHWSRELELDIALLKEEVEHLIAVHPHVIDFLDQLMCAGKERILVTNAHQKTLALKMEKTRLAGFFNQVISSHQLGLPKEDPEFWYRLQNLHPFDKRRTLFVDDSLSVLKSAREYGIHWLLAMLKPDSKEPAREVGDYPAIHDFTEITQGLRCTIQ